MRRGCAAGLLYLWSCCVGLTYLGLGVGLGVGFTGLIPCCPPLGVVR